jgi:hypothetical protein
MDEQLPDVGMISAFDPENKTWHWVNTSGKTTRKLYAENARQKLDYFRSNMRNCGAGMLEVAVTDNYVHKLMGYFKSRGGRR